MYMEANKPSIATRVEENKVCTTRLH